MAQTFPTPTQVQEKAQQGETLASAFGLPESALDLAYATAGQAYEAGNYDLAVAGFSLVAAARHKDPDSWVALARSYLAQGEPEAASLAYRGALALAPDGATYAELVRSEIASEDYIGAIATLKEARKYAESHSLAADVSAHLDALTEILNQS